METALSNKFGELRSAGGAIESLLYCRKDSSEIFAFTSDIGLVQASYKVGEVLLALLNYDFATAYNEIKKHRVRGTNVQYNDGVYRVLEEMPVPLCLWKKANRDLFDIHRVHRSLISFYNACNQTVKKITSREVDVFDSYFIKAFDLSVSKSAYVYDEDTGQIRFDSTYLYDPEDFFPQALMGLDPIEEETLQQFYELYDEPDHPIEKQEFRLLPIVVFGSSNPLALVPLLVRSAFEAGLHVLKCANCGRFFIAQSRSDEKYCREPSPQVPSRTCKQYGGVQTYKDNLNANESKRLYRSVYKTKQTLISRNPQVPGYVKMFERFKAEAKKWRYDVKTGSKTDTEYIEWLKNMKEKKV